ncbi:MAG: OmpL47-type beta-barrel domain-containing protein, partial [Alkalispirochaetaceae bacterium]
MNYHPSWTAKAAALGLSLFLLASTLSAQERRIYSSDAIDYAPKEARFVLAAGDLTENLDYIEYSVDGGEMTRYEEPIRIEEEGRHFITYRAVDITGNVSREKVYTVVIDTTPPFVSAGAVGPAYVDEEGTAYLTSESAVVLEAADRLSGVRRIYVSMDNEEFVPYTGPTRFEEEGELTGYAYAVDNVGNRTETFQANG